MYNNYISKDKRYDYTQCLLKRQNVTQVAWIPDCFAIRGNIIKIRNNGEWNSWLILEIYSTTQKEELIGVERARKQRSDTLK